MTDNSENTLGKRPLGIKIIDSAGESATSLGIQEGEVSTPGNLALKLVHGSLGKSETNAKPGTRLQLIKPKYEPIHGPKSYTPKRARKT